jgi:flagellar basal-body rod protein FlgB
MELDKIALFGLVKKRLAWLAQRQEVLARNIANADTPGYKPRDLKSFDFKRLLSREVGQVDLDVTNQAHVGGGPKPTAGFAEEKTRHPYESAPAGNAVILEEQMMKVGETTMSHKLTTELYKKHLNMIRTALGRGQ